MKQSADAKAELLYHRKSKLQPQFRVNLVPLTRKLDFFSTDHLKRWLKLHPTGQSVMHELTAEACIDCRHGHRKVLAVARPEGWVELYGNGIRFVVRQLLYSENAEQATLAEEYLEMSLAPELRQLYWPAKAVTVAPKLVTVFDEAYWQWKLKALSEIQGIDYEGLKKGKP